MSEGPGGGRADGALALFARRTSTGRYIPQIDGLRFVAIASVFAFHTQLRLHEAFGGALGTLPRVHDPIGGLLSQGRLGVHVFFVISGFVLGLPFAAQRLAGGRPVALKRYFLRRLTRIEPPYVVALVLFFLLAVGTSSLPGGASAGDLWAGAFYGHGLIYGTHNPINQPFWTLEIEVQFYLLVPLLAVVFAMRGVVGRRTAIVLAALAITLVQWHAGLPAIPRLSGSILNYLQFFLVGFLLADLYVVAWRERPTTTRAWDMVSLAGWPIFFAIGADGVRGIHVVLPWVALVLFVAAFKGTFTSRALGNRWVRTIGGMCYSIYLIHTPLLWILTHRTRSLVFASFGTANVLFQIAILAPVVLAISAGFFLLVEKPCMDPSWPVRLAGALRGGRRSRRSPETPSDLGVIDLTVLEVEDANIPR